MGFYGPNLSPTGPAERSFSVRKDAKIALCVILALMVLVVIIWGRSPRPDDDILDHRPQAISPDAVSPPDPAPAPTGQVRPSPPAPEPADPTPDPGPPELDGARRSAPDSYPTDHSALFPPDAAMMNHVQPAPDSAVVRHQPPTPPPPTNPSLTRDTGTPKGSSPTEAVADKTRTPAPAPRPAPAPQPETHTVVKGDTYIRIAEKHYNDGTKWRLICAANKTTPESLKIGQKLIIPPLPAATAKTPAARPKTPVVAKAPTPKTAAKSYTVRKGDSFYSIARNVYRDPTKWQKLYKHNRTRLPDPAKPGSLQAGTIIEIPMLASN